MGDALNLSMFRAYDIRTPARNLPPELVQRLAAAEARYFREVLETNCVLLAHDARQTGPECLTLAADEFRRAGLTVLYLPGPCSTCYFYFVASCYPEAAGVMIGASHNPAGDTGQKILSPGLRPIAAATGPAGGLDEIRRLYQLGSACGPVAGGKVRAVDRMGEYLTFSRELAEVERGELRGLRIFQDYLHGAAGREMMLGFEEAGAELSAEHFAADGRFPLGDPNPVKADVIRAGLARFQAGDFHLANFFDGDGDRIDFYHGDGRYVSSSFVYAALLPEIRRHFAGQGSGVYADLKSSPLAVIEMARSGLSVDIIRNGHSQIKHQLYAVPDRLGAVEESAHFYTAFQRRGQRFCTENTLYLALLAARVWRDAPERVEHLLERQATTVREREWGYKFASDPQRAAALQAVQEHFVSQGAAVTDRMADGTPLEATLMRRGLPFRVDSQTPVSGDWLQVCQRISQSEDGLARWEVLGSDRQSVTWAKQDIARLVARCGGGREYQG